MKYWDYVTININTAVITDGQQMNFSVYNKATGLVTLQYRIFSKTGSIQSQTVIGTIDDPKYRPKSAVSIICNTLLTDLIPDTVNINIFYPEALVIDTDGTFYTSYFWKNVNRKLVYFTVSYYV